MEIRRLLSDNLLVEVEPAREKTKSGIIIPDPDIAPFRVGRVLRAGPGRRYSDKFVGMEPGIIGERVVFVAAASDTKQGQEMRAKMSESQRIIRLGDCLLIVEGDVEIT